MGESTSTLGRAELHTKAATPGPSVAGNTLSSVCVKIVVQPDNALG